MESAQLVRDGLDVPKTVLEAAQKMAAAGGQCCFLPDGFLQLKPSNAQMQDIFMFCIFLAAAVVGVGGTIYFKSSDANPNQPAFGFTIPIAMGGAFAAMLLAEDIISGGLEKLKFNRSAVENLNFTRPGGGRSQCQLAPHPEFWEDNRNDTPGSGTVETIAKTVLDGLHFFHQKIAVVRGSAGWAGFCGGIDLNPNRLDDERHCQNRLYHDVHARVDGPAVRDLAITFIERWNEQNAPADQLSFADADLPPTSPAPGGKDIVQIARTNFLPNPATGAGRAFSYAPNGDRTILDTVVQAIRQAREYIYIEDQYFTPPVEYQDALVEAVGRVKSLVVLIPDSSDMIYGELHRAALIERLTNADPRAGTGNPVFRIGFSRRGYSLPVNDWRNVLGRMRLGEDCGKIATTVKLGPSRRVPTAPFWFSVNGEVMLATKMTSDPGSDESDAAGTGGTGSTPASDPRQQEKFKTFEVRRGIDLNFSDLQKGPAVRGHKKGDAATAVQFSGIFIHAKMMLADDVFASIGSANLDRRGFYADAEANIFAMPELLRFAADNPVKNLRKRLWAEILNLPPSLGTALLDDPVAASRLFARSCFSGNRFVPFRAKSPEIASLQQKLPGGGNFAFNGSTTVFSQLQNMLLTLAVGTQNAEYDDFYFLISDPSSFLQPVPD